MSSRPTAPASTVHEGARTADDAPWDEQLPWVEVGTPRRRIGQASMPAPAGTVSPGGSLAPTAPMAPTPVEPPAPERSADRSGSSLVPPAGQHAVAPVAAPRASANARTSPDRERAATGASANPAATGSTRATRGSTPRTAGAIASAVDLIDPHLRHHRWSVLAAGALLVVGIWMLAVTPLALDAAMQPPHTRAALALGGLIAAYALITAARTALLERAGVRAATDLRSRLLAHLHRHGSDGSDPVTPARFTEDVAALRDLVVRSLPSLATGVLSLVALLVVLVLDTPRVALLVAATALAYVLVMLLGRRLVVTRERRAAQQEQALAGLTGELLGATGTIRAYALEERADQDLAAAGQRADAARASARRTRALVGLLGALIAAAGVVVGLLMGADRVLALGSVLLGVVLMHRALGHLGELPAASAAGQRLQRLLEHRAVPEEPADARPLQGVTGEIAVEDLTAADPDLDAISVHIPAGQRVALLDRDGRHSAALLSYLMRSATPDAGQVLLDGQDVAGAPVADVRRHLAVVERDPALLTGTVRETIRVGRPEATDDEVTRAARAAGADGFIVMLADGYDTVLDAADPGLSEGQLRQLAIARAIVREAPVVLVDRAEEGLEGTALAQVRRALAVLTTGRTALVRSRDPHTVMDMDRVLWLDGGEIVEDGDPQRLAEDPDSHLSGWLHLPA